MLRSKKYVLTHSGTDYDITSDVTDDRFIGERRQSKELSFRLYDSMTLKYSGVVEVGDTITQTVDGTERFSGPIRELVPSRTTEGVYYDIVARSSDITLAKRTNGMRTYANRNIEDIVKGWAGDATFSNDVGTSGTVTITSSSADDTMTATIVGVKSTFIRNETLRLTGTSAATSANEYDDIMFVLLSSAANGTVTIADAGTLTLGTLSATHTLINKQDANSNYSNGLMYDCGYTVTFSQTPDYDIQDITFKHEYMVTSLDRLCDIGDSNGVWDRFVSGTTIAFKPRSDNGTDHDLTPYETSIEHDDDTTANRVILIGGSVKQGDGQYQEIIARASDGNGYEDMTVVDSDITDAADAEQKAANVLAEFGSVEDNAIIGPFPISPSIEVNDRALVADPNDRTTEYRKIWYVEHDYSTHETYVKCGNRRSIQNTIDIISGFDNTALYGHIGIQDLDTRRKYQLHIDANIASSYDYEFTLAVPEEGVQQVWLYLDGLKYRQASASTHYHDNDASFTVDAHDHGTGTLSGGSHGHSDGTYDTASHSHTEGTFDVDSHSHSYGTMKDTSQTHSFSNVSSFAYKSHNHDMGAYDSISSVSVSIPSGGSHNHGDTYSSLNLGAHTHTATSHTHSLTGNTANNTSGSGQLYYCSTSNINSSSAELDSGSSGSDAPDIDGVSGSASPDVTGTSGSASVTVSGTSGSSSASISGTSGSTTVGATMAEDTYPENVHIWIDGIDRTAALGGVWDDNFSIQLDISAYVTTDGNHTIAVTTTRNGRISGDVMVYY